MDKDEKRRLKKLGKETVARASRELQQQLAEANSAPVGSDEWVRNYRTGVLNERWLRANSPDRLSAAELSRNFVIHTIDQALPAELNGVAGLFWHCLACGDVISTLPSEFARCACNKVAVNSHGMGRMFADVERTRLVRLIGRGGSE